MFPSWLSPVLSKKAKPSRRQRRAARSATRPVFRPRLEALEDRLLLSATLPVSVDPTGTTMGNQPSSPAPASVSANGQYEVFVSGATNLVNGITVQPFSGNHVYLRNLSTGTTALVDVATDGTESGNNAASYASISPDGHYVAFDSSSSDLTNNDANVTVAQVYVRDMQTGQTYLVSLGTDGNPENGVSLQSPTPRIAVDGNGHLLIAYQSNATNLTKGDTNTHEQIFLATFNLDSSGKIQYGSLQNNLISADKNGNGAGTGIGQGGDSSNPVLSKDGSTLAFSSYATNLNVPGGYNDNAPNVDNLYLYSLANQTLKLLSVEPTTGTNATGNQPSYSTINSGGGQDNPDTTSQLIGGNGQYVLFTSEADNLVPGLLTDGSSNVYRRDVVNGTTSMVSINAAGTAGAGAFNSAYDPVMTPDGRYVAFAANDTAGDLTGNDPGGSDLFVRDMQQGQTYLVSLTTDGNSPNGTVFRPTIAVTSSGHLVISYEGSATNLTSGDTNGTNEQIFVATLNLDSNGDIEYNTLTTKLVSGDSGGNGANGDSEWSILSKDGSTLAFLSNASDLPGESGDAASNPEQLFAYNVASGKLTQVSPAAGSYDANSSGQLSSGTPSSQDQALVYSPISISDNGQYIAYQYWFDSTASNPNGGSDGLILGWNASTNQNTVVDAGNEDSESLGFIVESPAISGDGSTIAFGSGNVNGAGIVYAASNWQSGSATLSQVSPDVGATINGQTVYASGAPSISENGKVIAYNLDYTFTGPQVFMYDNGTITEVSTATSGGDANGQSRSTVVSADGSTIAFNSTSSNLVSGIADFINDQDNVFAYNVAGQTNSLVSAKAPGLFTTDADINAVSLSDNGRYVAYYTAANDLLGNLPGSPGSVFAEDLQKGVPTIIASNTLAQIYSAVISGDGSTVVFTDNGQLTGTKTNGEQIYATSNWQSSSPTTTLVSVNSTGDGGANQATENPSISDNGQNIAFDSSATNLTSNDADAKGYTQIFVHNLGTNTTSLASSNSAGTDGGDNNSDDAVLSADGSTVVYNSSATDLVSGVSVPNDSSGNPIVPNVYAYLSNTSAPVLTGQPSNQTVLAGQTATFTATASGSPPPAVQWQVSTDGGTTFNNISGASGTTLTLSNVAATQNSYEYRAILSNIYGTITSNTATLIVNYAAVVTTNPASQSAIVGQNITFTAVANGNPSPTVQWQISSDGGKTFTNISGATSTTLTLNNVTADMNGDEYQAIFTNSAGSATTSAATLTVNAAAVTPAIISGTSAAFTIGQGSGFTVTATGSPTPILTESGALPSGITFINNGNGTATLRGTPTAGTQGTYHISIAAQNSAGSVAQNFTLTVNPAAPKVPPLLAFFDSLLGGVETVNADGTETITDSFLGVALLTATFDSSGDLESVKLFGSIDITFLFA